MTQRPIDASRAEKPVKTLFGWLVFRRVSLPLALLLARTPLRPSHVTGLGLSVGVAGAVLLAHGGYWWALAGALLANVAKLLDAVDGELARAKHLDTSAGYVADGLCDRLRDTAVILGCGIGASRAGDAHALEWTLAAIVGYLAFFYVSAAAPSHWREIASERDLDEKHSFRVGTRLRLGAGDTLAVTVLFAAVIGRPAWFVVALALAAPIAIAFKVRRLFVLRPWERERPTTAARQS
ncbi:MAG: CDP-alcohol phosphatidyltransferase family protein [Actinomycetota bacterium]|nr:CDP-alcohol phosphatidyltransferase family protein [Actinomycetota bacterium]